MAAASSPAAISGCSGRERFISACCSTSHETLLSRQRIRVTSRRRQTHPILGSGFLGQLELRRTLAGRELGKHGGQNLRLRTKVGVARAGLPVVSNIPVLGPVLNAFFNPVVLFILYAAGASRFWSGFQRTTYSNSMPNKVALTALWPGIYQNAYVRYWLSRDRGLRNMLSNDVSLVKQLTDADSSLDSRRKGSVETRGRLGFLPL